MTGAAPLPRLELRHLVTLVTVAQVGSFTQAAARLGYTQSAISQHIRRLEQLVGAQLVERTPGLRGVELTPAGQVLLAHAETVVTTMERAAVDVEALSRGVQGVVRVGCFESVGASFLAPLAGRLRSSLPGVQVALTERPDDGDLLQLVAGYQLDLSFVVLPLPEGPFDATPLLLDPYVLAVAMDSPLALADDPIDLRSLENLRLMTYERLRSPHSLEERVGRLGTGSRIVLRSNHNTTLLSFAAHGFGAAVVSRLAVSAGAHNVHVRPLAAMPTREVGLAWHAGRRHSPAVAAFVRAAQAVSESPP